MRYRSDLAALSPVVSISKYRISCGSADMPDVSTVISSVYV